MTKDNKRTRTFREVGIVRDQTSNAFIFSSDIKDWMPSVSEKRDKQKQYTKIHGQPKRRI